MQIEYYEQCRCQEARICPKVRFAFLVQWPEVISCTLFGFKMHPTSNYESGSALNFSPLFYSDLPDAYVVQF